MPEATNPRRRPWNKGKVTGQKPPLKPREVWSIRVRLEIRGAKRDLALFNLAIDSKLRSCDLVALKVCDVAVAGTVRERAVTTQHKTGLPVQFELTEHTRNAVADWIAENGLDDEDYLFPSRFRHRCHLSPRQYARALATWLADAGLNPQDFGTHSLRRTKAAEIYKRTGNLRAVQILLGHTKVENTVRYLGVEVEDALRISEEVDL